MQTDFAHLCPADEESRRSGLVDPSPFLGRWVSTDTGTLVIRRAHVAASNGVLTITVWAANDVLLGEAEMVAFGPEHGGTVAAGAVARIEREGAEMLLAMNEKLGVLVISSFTTFRDGSGRSPYYARDFYHRVGDESFEAASRRSVDPKQFAGAWRNTNAESQGIVAIDIEADGRSLQLDLRTVDGRRWSHVPADAYVSETGSADAFVGIHDPMPERQRFAAYLNHGLLVLLAYQQDGREQVYGREFFYRL